MKPQRTPHRQPILAVCRQLLRRWARPARNPLIAFALAASCVGGQSGSEGEPVFPGGGETDPSGPPSSTAVPCVCSFYGMGFFRATVAAVEGDLAQLEVLEILEPTTLGGPLPLEVGMVVTGTPDSDSHCGTPEATVGDEVLAFYQPSPDDAMAAPGEQMPLHGVLRLVARQNDTWFFGYEDRDVHRPITLGVQDLEPLHDPDLCIRRFSSTAGCDLVIDGESACEETGNDRGDGDDAPPPQRYAYRTAPVGPNSDYGQGKGSVPIATSSINTRTGPWGGVVYGIPK